jgi:hypothetical protein
MPPLLAGVRARPGKDKPIGNTRSSTTVPPQNHRSGESETVTRFPAGLWLVGIHGGAGTTTLAAAGVGIDSGRRWPKRPEWSKPGLRPAPGPPPGGLLLVVRETAAALTMATKATAAVQQGRVPDWLQVLGLVVVAAGPGKPAKIVRERLELAKGWMPEVWRVPWVPELLAIDAHQVKDCTPFTAAIPPRLFALQELRRK